MEGGHFNVWTHDLVRKSTDRWEVGRTIERPHVTITVLQSDEDGEPLVISARFRLPLDDPSYQWVAWEDRGYVSFELPKEGEKLVWDIDVEALFGLK